MPATAANHFSAVSGGAYDRSEAAGMPTWREVRVLVSRELGARVSGPGDSVACMISAQWHVPVQNRLPGRPLFALDGVLDKPLLDALLRLVELQADAAISRLRPQRPESVERQTAC